MNLFDLHCDTAFELYRTKSSILSNNLAVSLDKYEEYSKKAQVFAIWSDEDKTDDECYLSFQRIAVEMKEQFSNHPDLVTLCCSSKELLSCDNKLCAILSVEDARLLSGDLSRLERLYENGMRILTLCWKGESCIGGAYDTDTGLTDFGFEVLSECEKMGIIVDVSHISQKGFWDVAGKATKPFIASHSNSIALCSHPRNLTDTQFRTISSCGGIVGVNLVAEHLSASLSQDPTPTESGVLDCVCSHIEHYLEIAPKNVCLGFDFDGTGTLPGLENVSTVSKVAQALSGKGYSSKLIDDLFYNNAYNFFCNNL